MIALAPLAASFACQPARVVDGDPVAAREALRALAKRGPVTCRQTDTDRYGRIVARCSAGGADLSCSMIAAGHAVRRYSRIRCP